MATDHPDKTVNGDYGIHHPYGQTDTFTSSQTLNTHGGNAATGILNEDPVGPPSGMPAEPAGATEGTKPPSKDEVGWYFVESYYTTLSKNPETLYLYYNKRSQFVSGVEAEKVDVSVGQRAINERIKELDFQDCKVRVSNVDSQESYKNIVVQVIGEISNKAAAHRKFTQTFVLAEQPKGYFVLNDIFRYITEDEEEEIGNGPNVDEEPEQASVPAPEPATLTSSADPVQQQHDVEHVDKKLEEEVVQKPSASDEIPMDVTPTNEQTLPETEVIHAEDAPAAAVKEPEAAPEDPEEVAESVTLEEQLQPEKPQDPDPTPVASPPKPAKAAPVETSVPAPPPKPAAPKTWANLVANNTTNRVAAPAVPSSQPSNPSATAAPNQPKTAPSTNRSATPPTSASDESSIKAQQNGNTGWQMAGSENNKKQGRQHSQSVSANQNNVLGYVKNVTQKVDESILRSTLSQYGKLVYFDVNPSKNCAFVEFADSAAYNAAVAANPHSIGGEQIYVEERRPRANAYGGNFAGRGGMRGGRGGNDGRPGSQGRGGYPKDGGRGGYTPRGGRGGNMAPRGRGQPQAA